MKKGCDKLDNGSKLLTFENGLIKSDGKMWNSIKEKMWNITTCMKAIVGHILKKK